MKARTSALVMRRVGIDGVYRNCGCVVELQPRSANDSGGTPSGVQGAEPPAFLTCLLCNAMAFFSLGRGYGPCFEGAGVGYVPSGQWRPPTPRAFAEDIQTCVVPC